MDYSNRGCRSGRCQRRSKHEHFWDRRR